MTVSLWRNLWGFSAGKKSTSSFTFFFMILQRYCKLFILGTLGMPGYTHPKWYYQLVENLCLSAGKKSTSSPMLFWRYWKDMQISFGYFGYAWLHTPKMIVSTCRSLWCLSPCQKYTSSLAGSILAHNSRLKILPDMGLVVKYR